MAETRIRREDATRDRHAIAELYGREDSDRGFLARCLLLAEAECDRLRELVAAYASFDDVIAALSDARREDYRRLEVARGPGGEGGE